METVWILVRQILQMFLLAAMGFILFKAKKITQEGSKTLGNILIYLALPAVIIQGFLVERTPERVTGLLLSAAVAAAVLILSAVIARLFFRKDAIAAFAGAFSNPGFFGVPLIIASVGQGAVFYVACFIAFLNIGQWTWGISLLTGRPAREGFRLKQLIQAPFFIAILVGLVLFATQLPLPDVVRGTLSTTAALNTPLAMFTVGIYLAQTDLKDLIRRKSAYAVAAVRLAVIPLIALLLLSLLPGSLRDMKTAILLAAACPVGSNVAVYAQLHGKDYPYAVETVVISTMLSLLTIPALVRLASAVW
jgi:predicted permease